MHKNDKIKVAVIGLGKQALEDHIPAVLASNDTELCAVVDQDEEKIKSFHTRYPDIPGFTNFDICLKEQNINLVIIALPHNVHCQIAEKAIKNGIHVLKEKPFAISLSEVRRIAKLAKENHVKVGVTLQRRFNPIYSNFPQFIDKIGRPFYINIKYTFYTDSPGTGWRGQKKLAGGGCLIDMGYHMIDLLMWYFGLPDQILMYMNNNGNEHQQYDAEDTAHVMFKYKNQNIGGSMLISRVLPPKQEFINVYGTRGIINLERGKIERCLPNGKLKESLQWQENCPSAVVDQLEYFVKVIRGEKENIASPELHLKHLAFIEAAYKSAEEEKFINPLNLL